MRRVPARATGTTGHPASAAARNAPRRNGSSPGARTKLPSGNTNIDSPAARVASTSPAPSMRCESPVFSIRR